MKRQIFLRSLLGAFVGCFIGVVIIICISLAIGGASVIWEVERWSLLRQTLTHFLLCSVVCLPIAWAMGWMADQPGWYLFGFVAMYAAIWLINYLQIRRRVQEINERLKQV